MKTNEPWITGLFLIVTATAVWAEGKANPTAVDEKPAQTQVEVPAAKARIDTNAPVQKIQDQQEIKRQEAIAKTSTLINGTVKRVDLYARPYMGRLGHLRTTGGSAEIFRETKLEGRIDWTSIKEGDQVEMTCYKNGPFIRALKVVVR